MAPDPATPIRSRRPITPWGILILAILTILGLWSFPAVERVWRVVLTGLTLLLSILACEIWFVFFSTFSRRTRIRAGLLMLLAPGLFLAIFRTKEFSGDIVPSFTWRWSKDRDQTLERLPDTARGTSPHPPTPDFPDQDSISDFPRFLGPQGFPAVTTKVVLDPDWSNHPPREVWRNPIGAGWSAFSIVGPYAITQEQRDTEECVSCYELATGKIRWSVPQPVRFAEPLGGIGPRATPTIHQGKVYAVGATGILNCIDGKTGKLLWSHETLSQFHQKSLEWAKSSSPLIVGNNVIISLQAPLTPPSESSKQKTDLLAAYDRVNGKFQWSVQGDKSSYASPRLGIIGGHPQIVNVNSTSVSAHDPQDGHLIWEYPWPGPQPKCTDPYLLDQDRVLLTAGYGLGGVLLQLTHSADGKWNVAELWKSRQLKTRFMNPVVQDGLIYGLDDGILVCVELETGKTRWRKGRYGHGQILLVGEHLLVLSESGELALVRASAAGYEELQRRPALNGKTWNTLALSGSMLLLRNAEEAVCYELATVK